jgi:predicted nuclease of restriction endonuclease-like (RecB) superfamily
MLVKSSILDDIKSIISQSKENAIRAVDHERVLMYWNIGKTIFEEEQRGMERAGYGEYLIKYLSEQLPPQFGSGFSYTNLTLFRRLYRVFPIVYTVCKELSWSHYRYLIRIDNQYKRDFYMAESIKNNWAVRQLERQINSQLFERLLISNDKEKVVAIARGEKEPSDAKEIIKDPMVLEFLGLKRESAYYEKKLESAILTHLQDFLLELGNGFCFIARQRRIHLDGDDFYVDMVLYNRLLQCFIIVEIKTHKITHQDIGQLQMYVNYFDRVERKPFENLTIGILLCTDKNNSVVKFTLPENSNIVASQYQLYLPSEQQLIEEVNKELEKF